MIADSLTRSIASSHLASGAGGGTEEGAGEIGYFLYKERPEKDSDSFLSGIERRTEVGWLVCVSHGPMWSEAGALVINSSKTKSTKGFRSGLYL